jgi:imidazolonepropionase-like amidohydrolase
MARVISAAICFLFALALVPRAASDEAAKADTPTAYKGARILTAAGDPIDNGVLVVHKGKIVSVGPADSTQAPENATVVDLAGKTIIPGMVDTHSHIGIYPRPSVPAHQDGNEQSGPVQSGIRALDAIYPDDPGIRMAVAGGITTANIMPGSSNVIGGQTVYVKLRGRTIDDMRIRDMQTLGGLKMANGENPKGYSRRQLAPMTRMKLASLQREQFVKARDYQRKWDAYHKAVAQKKETPRPETDLSLEPLVEVLQRKRTVHFHSHRADDLMTAMRIAEEFGFELVLHHVTEGYRIADEIARRKVPVSLTLVDSPGGKLETVGVMDENGAYLEKAGVRVAINTDDFITESRFFLRTGAIAVRGGMSEASALKALTIHGAEILHLDDRLGSLAPGKDADFVILSGAPFSVYTHVLQTYIDGKRVFDRNEQRDWAHQSGGFALEDASQVPARPNEVPALAKVQAPAVPDGTPPAKGSPKRLVVLAGRIHTVANGTITDGAILVEDGKISYVGTRDKLQVPDDTPVITAAEVTPGLIDAHTVVGLTGRLNIRADQDQDENSDPNQADLRVLDSFNPSEPLLEFLRNQGVTVIHAMPGRINVIAGQTGIFRTHGRTAEQMTVRFPAGLLVNLGEIPKETYTTKAPTTRMGTAALVRGYLAQAQGNANKRANGKAQEKEPSRNLKLEAAEPALSGAMPVIFSAHRADDLVTALRLSKEFHLHPVLDLATEAYLIADIIAESAAPVVVHPTMQRIGTMETFNSNLCNAAILADKKIPLAIGTSYEGYVPKTRVVRHEAAMAMVNGLGRERALRAITLDAAKLLGIDDRYGSLEQGKVADLVLYDGDPLEHVTHVTYTIMAGRLVYDRAQAMKVPFVRRALPLIGAEVPCCMGW